MQQEQGQYHQHTLWFSGLCVRHGAAAAAAARRNSVRLGSSAHGRAKQGQQGTLAKGGPGSTSVPLSPVAYITRVVVLPVTV